MRSGLPASRRRRWRPLPLCRPRRIIRGAATTGRARRTRSRSSWATISAAIGSRARVYRLKRLVGLDCHGHRHRAGLSSGKHCRATAGRVQVCNGSYGQNGWLGLAASTSPADTSRKGTVKVNDTYFAMAKYNNTSEKQRDLPGSRPHLLASTTRTHVIRVPQHMHGLLPKHLERRHEVDAPEPARLRRAGHHLLAHRLDHDHRGAYQSFERPEWTHRFLRLPSTSNTLQTVTANHLRDLGRQALGKELKGSSARLACRGGQQSSTGKPHVTITSGRAVSPP